MGFPFFGWLRSFPALAGVLFFGMTMRSGFFAAVFCLIALSACAGVRPGAAPACPSSAPTVIKDESEAKLLLGRHVFADMRVLPLDIYWKNTMPGTAWVTESPSSHPYARPRYQLFAQYETHADELCGEPYPFGESVSIIGNILEIRANEFDVSALISGGSHRTSYAMRTCEILTFSRRNHETHWSLQHIPAPQSPAYFLKDAALMVSDDPLSIFDKEGLQKRAFTIEKACRRGQ